MNPTLKRNIYRIIPFGLIWAVFSLIYSLLERGLLGTLDYYPSTGNPYNFERTVFATVITATLVGLLVGTIEILYLNRLFRNRSFLLKIIVKTLLYLLIIVVFLLLLTTIYNWVELQATGSYEAVWNNVWLFFTNFAFWSVEFYIAAIIGFSLFYAEVSENLGQSVLNNFLTGKYHQPKEEERIFMFLDMKSSTTIAEQIGHVRYFEMLREYFSDLTDSIIKYEGEIYQYVGDEIVISWSIEKGIQNNNCIRCFFSMKENLKSNSSKYIDGFGILPEFKAGLHLGRVTTGEIGVIKKEIIFTGDVLNTTARIQSLCNAFQVDLLFSEHLLRNLTLPSNWKTKALGETELRGRDEKVNLFTIFE